MTPDIIISKPSEVYFKIHAEKHVLAGLKNYLSCFAEGYKHHPKFKNKVWDGKTSPFKLTNRLLPIGLFDYFMDFAKENGFTWDFNFQPDGFLVKHSAEFYDQFFSCIFKDDTFVPRDYQREAIVNSIEKKRGIIEHATGAGKSLIIYCLIRYFLGKNRKVVLIVPNIQLVNQMKKEFKEYGWDEVDESVTLMHGETTPDFSKPILVATYQSLGNKDDSLVSTYSSVIVDEGHQANAKTIRTILEKLAYADYRIGLTATMPMQNEEELVKFYTIVGHLGPVISYKPANELISEGVLTPVSIVNVIIKYPDNIAKEYRSKSYEIQKNMVKRSISRMEVLDMIFRHTSLSENTLILCENIDHIDRIYKYVTALLPDFNIKLITGKIKGHARTKIQEEMEAESGIVLCATFGTLALGVNIKRIHQIITASSYKSRTKILQSLGRGMRRYDDKEVIYWYDLVDDLRWRKRTGRIGENYNFIQFRKRIEHYKQQGHPFVNKTYIIENWKGLYPDENKKDIEIQN